MVIKARRIPADSNTSYSSWSFPTVTQGRVVKAQKSKARRQTGLSAMAAAAVPAPKPNLAAQVTANVKAGKYVQGISARELESIIVESAREGREAGYAEGHRKGFEQGLAQGQQEGLDKGQGIIEDGARRLSLLLTELNDPIASQLDELKSAMLGAITRIARDVVRRELATRPDVIEGLIDEAVAAMPVGAANLSISLNPSDIDLVQSAGHVFDPSWSIVADGSMQPGGCRVVAADSLVEFSQSERLEKIIARFLDAAETDR